MQKEFVELYKKYGFDNPNKSRDDLLEDEERNFVNDCFDIYEHIGFAETFGTTYTGEEKYEGMRFTVLGRVKEITEDKENGADLECLPMWNIQFENGGYNGCISRRNMFSRKKGWLIICTFTQ